MPAVGPGVLTRVLRPIVILVFISAVACALLFDELPDLLVGDALLFGDRMAGTIACLKLPDVFLKIL